MSKSGLPVYVAGDERGVRAVDLGTVHLVARVLAVRLPVAGQFPVHAGAVVAPELAATAVSARGLVGEVATVVVPIAFGLFYHAPFGRVRMDSATVNPLTLHMQ